MPEEDNEPNLQECHNCHQLCDLLQIRLNQGQFICDECLDLIEKESIIRL